MGRWLVVLLVLSAAGLLWLRQRERRESRPLGSGDMPRRPETPPLAARPSVTGSASGTFAESAASGEDRESRPLRAAAETALGQGYAEATSEIREMRGELAAARRAAEQDAARVAQEAETTLAAVQAAAAHGGAVPGDGTANCPAAYPVKGILATQRIVEPGQAAYDEIVPDLCFQSVAAATAAGFSPAQANDSEGETSGMEGAAAGIVAGIGGRAQEDGGDVVAEAIEAAGVEGVPPGAVRGDGGRECPPTYPIKGNKTSMLYHEPGSRSYAVTIPEFCFSSVESAEVAGFSAPRR